MSLIQCSQGCEFQIDGYCRLEKCGFVNSTEDGCPYFKKKSFNKGNGFSETSNTDKF